MPKRPLLAACALTLLPALAGAWGHKPGPPPEDEIVAVPELGGLEVWPFTTNDFDQAYDPVNLMFPNLDPRQIRQALLGLAGERPWLQGLPFAGCTWADAMGSEQAAWAKTEGWVGGEVQLVCINPDQPSPFRELGDPFRVHMRLYREGDVTLGAAHFEVLIPNTAQHEVLSWDFARDFVFLDLVNSVGLQPAGTPVLQDLGSFRKIRRQIYDGIAKDSEGNPSPSGQYLLENVLKLEPPDDGSDVPLPLAPIAPILTGDLPFDPVQKKIHNIIAVKYDIEVPRPFCAESPYDAVRLEGWLYLGLSVHTNPSGKYDRRHWIWGTLDATPGIFTMDGFVALGPAEPADIREYHRALLTDRYGQLLELGSQALKGAVPDSLWWRLDAGHRDRYRERETCAP